MDITQFSKCLKELIEDNDKVEVPHLGTFFADYVPASFSDKHTTINPPTREMSFVRSDVEPRPGNIFLGKMMQSLGLSEQQAAVELGWCLSRIISELEGARVCVLPGLGKMKANARKDFFFVPDDDLEIYPEGLGFEAINIKASAAETGTKTTGFVPEAGENPDLGTETPDSVPEPATEPATEPALNPALNPATEPALNPAPEPDMDPEPTYVQTPASARKSIISAIWPLIVAAAIVVIVVALYLLSDTPFVSNLLDKILYTEEELQLLGR